MSIKHLKLNAKDFSDIGAYLDNLELSFSWKTELQDRCICFKGDDAQQAKDQLNQLVFKLHEADYPRKWLSKVAFVNGDESYVECELDAKSSEFK